MATSQEIVDDGNWTVELTKGGEIEARRHIPYEGTHRITTSDAPGAYSKRKQSQYGLSEREVFEALAAEPSSVVTEDDVEFYVALTMEFVVARVNEQGECGDWKTVKQALAGGRR